MARTIYSALMVGFLLIPAGASQADVIVQNTATPGFPGTFNYIGYNASSVAFGQPVASQFLAFGGRFHTSPLSDQQTFAAQTTVTATQNGHSFNVPYLNSLPDPNLFFKTIAYDPSLRGSWELSVSNPNYAPVTFNTSAIPASLAQPTFITGIALSGSSNTAQTATTPRISWTQPAYNPPAGYGQATRVFIVDLNDNQRVIYRADMSNSQTTFDVPAEANLSQTGHYGVIIRNDFRTASNATNGASSQSYFDFTPSTLSHFDGPVYVPVSSVNSVGQTVYSFNLDVSHGQSTIWIRLLRWAIFSRSEAKVRISQR